MDIASILSELKQRRDRLDTAIAALEASNGTVAAKSRGGIKRRRHMSAEARARIAAGMRKRWAAAKKAGRATLAK